MNPYDLLWLNERLIYITWNRTPTITEAQRFVLELQTILDEREEAALYFMSDLRRGRIIDIRVIQMLSKLAQHEKWSGSVAFTSDPVSRSFVSIFQNMVVEEKERNLMFDEFEKAQSFLETLAPGITAGIDWEVVLGGNQPAPGDN